MTFQEIGLKNELQLAIQQLGFKQPTEVQQQAIPFLLDNNQQDLIALAQTGTGKTAAFSLPVLHQIDINDKTVQCLILCPTRELCLQIAKDIKSYTSELRSLKTIAVYGGTSVSQQKKQLKRGAHIVVGTPGRTLDLIRQRALDIRSIQWLVLDEADEMLNMGFKDDLESILSNTPKEKQTLLFSATMPKSMNNIVQNFMNNPHRIEVAKRNIGSSNVEHHFYVTKAKDRYATLQRLVDANPDIYAIIFCRTRRETQQIADKLMAANYNADTIHGDLSQNQRDSVMNNFKQKNIQILVATDVAARGIDVDELTHVINYQLPDDPEVYVHRSGRTGRAGNTGISICIINTREGRRLGDIEKMIGKEFIKKEIPTGQQICETQIRHFIHQIKTHESDQNLMKQYYPIVQEELGELGSDIIINRLLSLEISRFLETYEGAPDLNAKQNKKEDTGRKDNRRQPNNWAGFTLNAGTKQNMKPKRLIALVNEQTDSNDIPIGEIIIKVNSTYFEVGADDAQRISEAFQDFEIEGKPAVEVATRRPEQTQTKSKSNNSKKSNSRSGGKRGSNRKGGGKRNARQEGNKNNKRKNRRRR